MERSNRVSFLVNELSKLILKRDDPEFVKDLMNLIRPVSSDITSGEHTNAIKKKIKDATLRHRSHCGDGPIQVALFDKEIDKLRKINPKQLHPFLAMIEPLMFGKITTYSISKENIKTNFDHNSNRKHENIHLNSNMPSKDFNTLLPIHPNITLSTRDVEILESGNIWINKSVETLILRDLLFTFQEYSKSVEEVQIQGLVAQALGFAIQEQLHDYYRLLAVLEQEISARQRDDAYFNSNVKFQKDSKISPDEVELELEVGSKRNGSGSGSNESNITLLRLRIWMQEPLERTIRL
eukprot:gene3980-7931_t